MPSEELTTTQPIRIPTIEAVPIEEEPEKPKPKNDMSDMFEVPQPEDNDMYVEDLVEAPGEEDMSDLMRVTNDDIMGTKRKKSYKITHSGRKSIQQPPSMGGMQ